ncbi:DUF3558 domain-containing protein [Parasphingorhabdus pacifica]
MQRRATLISVAALALSLTGCAQSSEGTAESAPDSGESAASTQPSEPTDPALRISNPKDLGTVTDACDLLTPEQLTALSAGTEAEPDTTVYGESKCSWRNDDFRMTVALNATTGTGPEKIHEDGKASDNFQPTEVDGYPAARVDEQSTLCRVEVGIADDQAVAINYSKRGGDAPELQDPCGYAEKIASEALKNIPDA